MSLLGPRAFILGLLATLMLLSRLIILILLVGTAADIPLCLASPLVNLPPLFDTSDALVEWGPSDEIRLEVGGTARGESNILPLSKLDDKGLPAQKVHGNSSYARLQGSGWMRLTRGEWWFGTGKGIENNYRGNRDAGQLWVDLHGSKQTLSSYSPVLDYTEINASWYGIGHRFPFNIIGTRGTGEVSLRYITANDFLAGSILGNVDGEQFTGMVRRIRSDAVETAGSVTGRGWVLDARVRFSMGTQWRGSVSAEGLLGRISWHGLSVEDGYITSSGAFEDPDGFLHDFGGISGLSWREDLTARPNPLYRVDFVSDSNPAVLLGLTVRKEDRSIPNFGVAWTRGHRWIPYARIFPTESHVELGAVARGWQLRISSDGSRLNSTRQLGLAASASAWTF